METPGGTPFECTEWELERGRIIDSLQHCVIHYQLLRQRIASGEFISLGEAARVLRETRERVVALEERLIAHVAKKP